MITQIDSLIAWKDFLKTKNDLALLVYKSVSETSKCAFDELAKVSSDFPLASVDVSVVKDVHTEYGVSSAPSLLLFENGVLINVIKGCMDVNYYTALFEKRLFSVGSPDGKKVNRIILYSTPSCSWCNTIKSYFRKQQINYREVDVSKDEKALQEMIAKSGQQGVPQTDINGQMVVGFDQKKIDSLLGLN